MPIAIDLTVSLAFVVALLVSFGLLYAWRGIGKPILLSFALLFNIVSVPWIHGSKHPFGFIASWLQTAAETIDHSLAQLVLNCEKGVVGLWHALAVQVRLLGRLLGDLGDTIDTRFKWIALSLPPVALVWLAVRAARQIPAVWKAIHTHTNTITEVRTRVVRTTKVVTHETKVYVTRTAHAAAATTTKAIAAPIPWVNGRLHGLELDWKAIKARMGRAEVALLGAGALALVGSALARLGLGFLRCPRFTQAGNRVCGMNPGLLDSLLADTALIVGTISLVEFAREMEDITDRVAPLVAGFWRAA